MYNKSDVTYNCNNVLETALLVFNKKLETHTHSTFVRSIPVGTRPSLSYSFEASCFVTLLRPFPKNYLMGQCTKFALLIFSTMRHSDSAHVFASSMM